MPSKPAAISKPAVTTVNAASTHGTRRSNRRATSALGCALALAGLVAVPATVQQSAKAQSTGGSDYAVEAWGDPWDYNNPEDQILVEGQTTVGIQNARVANGKLGFDVSGGSYFHLIWGGYPDTVPTNRDGAIKPIDTDRFNRIVMKVTASAYTPAGLRWYSCTQQNGGCEGGMPVTLEAGTHVYDLPVVNSVGSAAWQGGRPISLRMIFSPYGPTHVDVEWVRLTGSGDGPVDEWNGPVLRIEDPDVTGGNDYATMARNGDAWDMSSADDLLRTDNVAGQFQNGVFEATNAGPVINDPGVTLKVPVAFNADDFHRATVNFTYDGELNLEDKVGGGQNARLMWRIAGTPLTKNGSHNQVSRDVVTFPGQNSFTVDLKTNPSTDAVDPRSSPRIGWAGNMIEMFRFDPNEDRGARRWRIDSVKLADDDAGETNFAIRLRDANPAPGTQVKLFADTDSVGYNGQLIADNVDISGGTATVNWTPPAGTKGLFWIYAVTTRGGFSTRTYSTGPVRMGSPVGKYTFGPATGGPQGQINFGVKPEAVGVPTGNPPAALALTPTTKKPGKKAPAVKAPTKKVAATK
jgi:hypothetical protein